jgi:AcrR family transcriptional regulator
VRRSRAALFAAAVTLVNERATTALSITDLADEADVSRRLVYQQFTDKDALLLEAAVDFTRRELKRRVPDIESPDATSAVAVILPMAAHFAEHRVFYRTMLTGSCAYAFNAALGGLFAGYNQRLIREQYGDGLDKAVVRDLTAFLTGGVAAIVHSWVVEGPDPLAPAELVDRLDRIAPLVLGELRPGSLPRTASSSCPPSEQETP